MSIQRCYPSLLLSLTCLTSCTANYISQQIPTPLFTSKGEFSTLVSFSTEKKLSFEGAYSLSDNSAIIATFESRGHGLSHDASRSSLDFGHFWNKNELSTMFSGGVCIGSTRTGPGEVINTPWIANNQGLLAGNSDFVQLHAQGYKALRVPLSSFANSSESEIVLGAAARTEYAYRYKFEQTQMLWSAHYDEQNRVIFDTTITHDITPKHTIGLSGAVFASIGSKSVSIYTQLLLSFALFGYKDYWNPFVISAGLRVQI